MVANHKTLKLYLDADKFALGNKDVPKNSVVYGIPQTLHCKNRKISSIWRDIRRNFGIRETYMVMVKCVKELLTL